MPPTPEQSNAVIDDSLKYTLSTLLASALAGGTLGTLGFMRRPKSTEKIISTPLDIGAGTTRPNVVKLPYPEEEEEEKKAGLAQYLPFLGRDPGSNAPIDFKGWLAGHAASNPMFVPWFLPATAIGGTAAFMGGSSLAESILKKKRKEELKAEVDKAKEEFEQALQESYDPKVVGLQKASMLREINQGLEKLAVHLKVAGGKLNLPPPSDPYSLSGMASGWLTGAKDSLVDTSKQILNKMQEGSQLAYDTSAQYFPGGKDYNLVSNVGGGLTGLLGTTLLASPLLAGYLAYKHYDRQNPTKLLQERLREKQYDRMLQNAPEVYVERTDEEEEDEKKEKKAGSKPGLWDRIHAKRQRGEKPAKPGDSDYPDKKSWEKTTKESSAENLQPGTEEFNSALYKHLYGKKKTKDPQPGTEEFNSALYKHLYGKEKPKATNESYKKKED